jgi:GNAT superfamily N-acetyltransferase
MTVSIRQLLPDDWQTLREIRLAALLDAPDAFASSYELTLKRSEQEWRTWPARGVVFGAFVAGEPVGMVGATPVVTDPDTVHLIAMWAAPAVRGTGVADRLIDAVVEWAQGRGSRSVWLEVATGNDRAAAVYLRNGFTYSNEPPSIPDTVTMRRPVD